MKKILITIRAKHGVLTFYKGKRRVQKEKETLENTLIYIVDIEAVDTRYTKQWKEFPFKQLIY